MGVGVTVQLANRTELDGAASLDAVERKRGTVGQNHALCVREGGAPPVHSYGGKKGPHSPFRGISLEPVK